MCKLWLKRGHNVGVFIIDRRTGKNGDRSKEASLQKFKRGVYLYGDICILYYFLHINK